MTTNKLIIIQQCNVDEKWIQSVKNVSNHNYFCSDYDNESCNLVIVNKIVIVDCMDCVDDL